MFLISLSMQVRRFTSRVAIYKKGETFLGVSLDFGMIAEEKTFSDAHQTLEKAMHNYLLESVNAGKPDEDIYKRLPKKYEDVFELVKDIEISPYEEPTCIAGEVTFEFSSRAVDAEVL
jgi:hypothetical protein